METHSCKDLLEAAREGHDECIKKLIVAGADLNVVNAYGQTPLNLAAGRGHDTLCKTLIEAGADVNVADTSGWTPFHWAGLARQETCMRILIDAGADLPQCDSLYHAAYYGHDVRIRTLIAAGANPNAVDNAGMTPLHDAAFFDHTVYVWTALIASGADLNAVDNCGLTPLHIASSKGRAARIRTLVDAGADLDIIDKCGKTPLHLAVEKDHKECAKILVECILAKRALADDEWDLITTVMNIGPLLPVVLARYGRDAAAKLVSKLPEEKQKVLETATMCLSRFVSRDVAEQILVRCV